MKKTLTAERRNELAKILLTNGSVKVRELAELFHVSTETIRKDIIYLDKEGIAKKSHGGAMAVSNNIIERPVSEKELVNADIKAKIAEKALSLITPGSTILLDTGSTTYALAKLLTLEKGLTIFTNSLKIASLLTESDNDIFTFGGAVRRSSHGIVGHWATNELNSITVNMAFLGTDGAKGSEGPCSSSFSEAEFKKNCVKRSNQTVVLTDSTKFEITSIYNVCSWSDVSCLVTDRESDLELSQIIGEETEILYV